MPNKSIFLTGARACFNSQDVRTCRAARKDVSRARCLTIVPELQFFRVNAPGAFQHIVRACAGSSTTTNAIEALNSKIRRAVRTRGHLSSDGAAMKLLYLVLNQAAEDWKRPPREWRQHRGY
ncbi:transposase [Nitratireductor sp. XY-223]|uniref:transposase n=1 Tax=Nitratireductor sp. XY-223 TaxID=2561926 RepID=UPI002484855D|nr:transposase [Nitratireductor sp. XY-223]